MSEEQKAEQNQGPAARQPIFLLPGVVTVLCGLMVAVHIAASFLAPEGQAQLILWFGFIPLRLTAFATHPVDVLPLIWTPVTHAFLHANWEHLIINVAWLAIFATPMARRYGAVGTVGLFLLSAVAGAAAFAITTLVFGMNTGAFLIGASGGVAGLTGAATRFIFQPVLYGATETGEPVALGRRLATVGEVFRDKRARYFALIWIVLNAAIPILPIFSPGMDMQIAWQAHLGGFLCGFFLVPLLERRA